MQLFTTEQIFQVIIDANNLYSKLAKVIFDTSIKEIFTNFGNVFYSLMQGDWKTFIVSAVILIGLIVFVYRLVRKKPFLAIRSIFNR